ncbi:JmjC domain-containing protein [Aphelenchoides besseyi]|nr:JmjC domain-containing protein [Aphelenchoides besseyi]
MSFVGSNWSSKTTEVPTFGSTPNCYRLSSRETMSYRLKQHTQSISILLCILLASTNGTVQQDDVELYVIDDESGGWYLPHDVTIEDNGRCTIERRDGRTLTQEEFLNEFAYQQPVIIENIENRRFAYLTQKKSDVGAMEIHAETWYLFGDSDPEIWKDLLENYQLPKWTVPNHEAALSFGIANCGTGVPFHYHGPGFSEVIYGAKRWFLTPPDQRPKFDPDKSSLDWFLNNYPKLNASERPFECTIQSGEAIYFPNHWYHSTLNMKNSVFISTFLSPKSSIFTTKNEL